MQMEQNLLRCYLEQGLTLLRQLETALAAELSTDYYSSMNSEKLAKKDTELQFLRLERTQLLTRFCVQMQEMLSR
jgi:hypothetical protein